ncbi:DNA replication/repair protein RecF [Pelobacter propionicus]|uniref:DNA replication and repair protein RecF n=1 Tax=Pelobacter propionicus (strain DSM 2379 / NBRC 103807 / OttBd1) TaxID=338966 RepID=A1AJX4_PELPD|nr:DNA replication/repair protein RecF [Pelobacter propionicus]ABK97644.1 DNA replication and repair protein RecF [Pelobacter propionicus DSM 2379]
MRLTRLSIADFRNIGSVRFTPGRCFNLIHGRNGQGKTNLLEAIYLLGSPRSFRNARLPDFIRHGEQRAHLHGEVESAGIHGRIGLSIENAGRRVELDGKGIQRASDLYGRINVVVFSPDDTAMVRYGPETRRRYLDRTIYMCDIGYLHCWHAFQRILKQRNQLLKNSDKSGLDTWTEQLAETGAEIIVRRRRFVERLNGMLQRHYGNISAGEETASVAYEPEGINSQEQQRVREELLELFQRSQQSDIRQGTTTAGPHRDDLKFRLDGRPLKSFGSTGQQKSFVLALKMAEIDNLTDIFGEPPLLLLDDVSSELDDARSGNLLHFLLNMDIQVFMTTTQRSPVLLGAAAHCAVFHVEHGNLTFEGNEKHE